MTEQRTPYELPEQPEQHAPASPTSWLWAEIERRFGKEAADDLHVAHNEQLKLYARRQAVEGYRRRLPGMKWQLEQRRKEGSSTKVLEKSIALAEERLREAGIPIPGMGTSWFLPDESEETRDA